MNTNLLILILLIIGVVSGVIALILWRGFFRFSTPSKNLADKIAEVQTESKEYFAKLISNYGYLVILGLVIVLYAFGWQLAIGYAIAILIFFSLSKAVVDLVGVRASALIEAAKTDTAKKTLKRTQFIFGFLATAVFVVLLTVFWGTTIDQNLYLGAAIAAIFLALCACVIKDIKTPNLQSAIRYFSAAFELVVFPALAFLALGAFNFKFNLDKPLTISIAIFVSAILFYALLLRLNHLVVSRAISDAKELANTGLVVEKLKDLEPRGKKFDKICKWLSLALKLIMVTGVILIAIKTLTNLGFVFKFDFNNKMLMIALGIKILTLLAVASAIFFFRARWKAILSIFIQTVLLSTLLFVISPSWPLTLNVRMVVFAGVFCLSTVVAIFFGVIRNVKKV